MPSVQMIPMPSTAANAVFKSNMKRARGGPKDLLTSLLAGGIPGLDQEGVEVFTTAGGASVLVDRKPMVEKGGSAYLRSLLRGDDGNVLKLVGELDHVCGSVWHGTYSGLVGGTAVLVDQYVQLRNCVPVTIIRVITRVNRPTLPRDERPDDLVKALLDGLYGPDASGMPCP